MGGRNDDHPHYSECGDPNCPRFACQVWKDGYRRGWDDGCAQGYAEGYAQGWADKPPEYIEVPVPVSGG
jgi:hypothetical protein